MEENWLKDRSSTRSAGSDMVLGNPICIVNRCIYIYAYVHTHTLTGETVVSELEHHQAGAGGRFSQDLEILKSQCPREFMI